MRFLKKIEPIFVTYIPDNIEVGKLYISLEYAIAIHKCCCGCGQEVVTPLDLKGWRLTQKKKTVSLLPSIGNWKYECQSHYFIKHNKIVWLDSTPSIRKEEKIASINYSLLKQISRFYQYVKQIFYSK